MASTHLGSYFCSQQATQRIFNPQASSLSFLVEPDGEQKKILNIEITWLYNVMHFEYVDVVCLKTSLTSFNTDLSSHAESNIN